MDYSLKFIHLSDLHLLPARQKLYGIDTTARLEAAIECICSNFADAEFCMVTGDLAEAGDVASYQTARRILDRLPHPWHGLMGNHDGRTSNAQIVLPDLPWQANGSLQYALETQAGVFIVLDSSVGGVDSGKLDTQRLDFLSQQLGLSKASGKDVFLFMHHVPFDIGIGWLDAMKLENSADLWQVLKGFENIRHMFFGHIHRPTHGSWHGIPFSTVRATAHQVLLNLENTASKFVDEDPSFAVVMVAKDQVVIHDHAFPIADQKEP